MRKILITAAVIFFGFAAKAQVRGTLIDSATLKPIENAVVGLVLKSDLTDTSYTFADTKGVFRFDVVPTAGFTLIIRHLGYRAIAKFVPVNKVEKSI